MNEEQNYDISGNQVLADVSIPPKTTASVAFYCEATGESTVLQTITNNSANNALRRTIAFTAPEVTVP